MGSACGFCVKAESMLKPQIDSGEVVKKSASEADGKFNGFPAFESSETGKTHTGLPQSYEQLAKKLGHAEHYRHSQGKGHHNPYNYNAMPVRAPADECSPCIPPFSLDGGGNLVKPPGMSHKQCVSARKKCPGCDMDSDPCAPAPKPKPPSGPGSSPAYRDQCNNKSPSDLPSCCAKACNNNTQSACYMECEESGPLPTNCNPPPKGMSGTDCCEKGGQAGEAGQCPPGCNDQGGECVPASGGGGGDPSTKCAGYPEAGCYNWDADDNTCEYMGQQLGPHCQYKSCTQCFAAHGHGGGGGGGGGEKSCTLGTGDCSDSQYCSIASKKCSDPPSTWTSDFYNSAIQDMTSGPDAPSPDTAKCIVNGIAASSGCNVTNPSQLNTSAAKTCVAKTVGPNCKNPKYYPNSPVKSSNGGGGDGGGGGDSKKGPSALEIIIIVVAVLALLGLVGFLAYRAKK